LGDELLGPFGCDWFTVRVADDVGHAPAHDDPRAFGQTGRDHAERLEVNRAAFDHLDVIDPGQLRILLAGVISGADQCRSKQA
jgi:hypothetical protein